MRARLGSDLFLALPPVRESSAFHSFGRAPVCHCQIRDRPEIPQHSLAGNREVFATQSVGSAAAASCTPSAQEVRIGGLVVLLSLGSYEAVALNTTFRQVILIALCMVLFFNAFQIVFERFQIFSAYMIFFSLAILLAPCCAHSVPAVTLCSWLLLVAHLLFYRSWNLLCCRPSWESTVGVRWLRERDEAQTGYLAFCSILHCDHSFYSL